MTVVLLGTTIVVFEGGDGLLLLIHPDTPRRRGKSQSEQATVLIMPPPVSLFALFWLVAKRPVAVLKCGPLIVFILEILLLVVLWVWGHVGALQPSILSSSSDARMKKNSRSAFCRSAVLARGAWWGATVHSSASGRDDHDP